MYMIWNEQTDKKLSEEIVSVIPEVQSIRRQIHMYPETGYDTVRTMELVRTKLRELGIPIIESKVGVIARIPGSDHSRMIGLRADMDALPIQEENQVGYASRIPGKMHACGHDAHTAMLLGAARILNDNRNALPMDVLLIFQPAEEAPSPGGAKPMLKELDEKGMLPQIVAMFGQHIMLDFDVGKVGWIAGPIAASTDEFYLTIRGKGGHAGRPQRTIDAISVGCKVVNNLESYMSRRIDPMDSAVASVGMFHSGQAINVVAETAEISGTIRCLKETTRETVLKALKQIAEKTCETFGAVCELKTIRGVPVTYNDPDITEYIRTVAEHTFGADSVFRIPTPMMGAEDFAWFGKKIPCSYAWLGCWSEGYPRVNHQPRFDFDEQVLPTGVRLLTAVALHADHITKSP